MFFFAGGLFCVTHLRQFPAFSAGNSHKADGVTIRYLIIGLD